MLRQLESGFDKYVPDSMEPRKDNTMIKVKNDGTGLSFSGEKAKKAIEKGKVTAGLLAGAGLAIGAALVHGLSAGAVVTTKVANKTKNSLEAYVKKNVEVESD